MILILHLLFWLAVGASQQTAPGSIEGVVLRGGTTDPIERVRVTLTPGSPAPITVLTDKEGRFSFPEVKSGRYTITIQRDGYVTAASTPAPADITVSDGKSVAGLTYH